ncbi:MAG TPA: carbohydrate kinase family protein [Candidatus Peribacterales bacterium]|nr:carbohydrate kinase family protein [Candidatus Peribacterales bacterium]
MSSDHANDVEITSIGGAAFDVFVRAPHETVSASDGKFIQFPLGAKIKIEKVMQSCGGGAANTSVGFSRLGLRSQFCGVIGDDEWGQKILSVLKEEKVSTETAIIVEQETSGFSIILVDPATGERTILYAGNVNAHLTEPVFPKETLSESPWIFLNHLAEVSTGILDDLCEITESHSVHLAWNPGGTQIKNGFDAKHESTLLQHTHILFLNKEEALLFTKAKTIEESLRRGTSAGAKIMCITDASQGAFLSDGSEILSTLPQKNLTIVDTTGAGDAFAVGVTAAVIRGLPLPTALQTGMINAASVISVIGSQPGLLRENELRSKLLKSELHIDTSSL